MHFKGSGPIIFAFLAFAFIVGTCAADYGTFLRQHYDNPKSSVGSNYCDAMMQRRDPSRLQCKVVNSFVHDTEKNIISVCGTGGVPYRPYLRRSKKQFSVTTCELKGGSTRPPCNYKEYKSNRYIVIACRNNLPVHYNGQI